MLGQMNHRLRIMLAAARHRFPSHRVPEVCAKLAAGSKPGGQRAAREDFNTQWLIVAMWVTVMLAGVLLSLVPPIDAGVAVKQVGTAFCGVCLSFAVTTLATRALLQAPKLEPGWLVGIVLVAGTTLWLLDSWIQVLPTVRTLSVTDLLVRRYNWVYFTLLFGLQVLALALIASARAAALQQRRLVEAQLSALRFQLNPHFLFNTLNAVAALVEEQANEAAEEMIARLAEFLRATLSEQPRALVPLARELETIQAYLDIEDVRFGQRLRVTYDIAGDTSDLIVPSLILQPIVENAIKHAVAPSIGGASIEIRARVVAGDLILTVQDCASPQERSKQTAAGMGVGLRNVQARLDAHFGADGKLETGRAEDGFVATLSMPARRASAEEAS